MADTMTVWDILVSHWPDGVPLPRNLSISGSGTLWSGGFTFSLDGFYLNELRASEIMRVTAWNEEQGRHTYSGWFVIPRELRLVE